MILIGILVLGAYLRLYKISQYMTFLGDEGRDMLVVLHMIVNHKWTLLGPTASVGGFFLGPIYYYFMLPFVWLWNLDPTGASVMVALFGVCTIYLVYRLGRDLFDVWVGCIAALLYALSPLVIAYSRSSWNPNLVPFFSTLLIYLVWKSVVRQSPKLLFWVGVVLGIGLQLHYLFLFLFPVVGAWYLLYGRTKRWIPYYAVGAAGFFIGYGPFLAFELRHGFPNTISIFNFLREGKDTGFAFVAFSHTVTDVIYRLFGRLVFRFPPPEQWVNMTHTVQRIWDAVIKFGMWSSLLLAMLYASGGLTAPWNTDGRRQQSSWYKGIVLLFLWLIIPLALFGLYRKGIYDYYFGIFFALPFICIALVVRSAAIGRIGKAISILVIAGLVYFNSLGRPFLFAPNNQLGQTESIAREALEKTGGRPFNFALITSGNSDHAYRFFFERWGRAPVQIENTVIDPQRSTVTDQLIVVCELEGCQPLGNSLWEVAGFGRAEIENEWRVSFVTIYKLGHYTGAEL